MAGCTILVATSIANHLALNAAVFMAVDILLVLPFASAIVNDASIFPRPSSPTITIVGSLDTSLFAPSDPTPSPRSVSSLPRVSSSENEPVTSLTTSVSKGAVTTTASAVTDQRSELPFPSSAQGDVVLHLSTGAVAGLATLGAILIAIIFFILGRSRFGRRRHAEHGVVGER